MPGSKVEELGELGEKTLQVGEGLFARAQGGSDPASPGLKGVLPGQGGPRGDDVLPGALTLRVQAAKDGVVGEGAQRTLPL